MKENMDVSDEKTLGIIGINSEYAEKVFDYDPIGVEYGIVKSPVKEGETKQTYIVFRGQQQQVEAKTESEWLNISHKFLDMNDAEIICDMEKRERDSFILCNQIEKLDDIVKTGHIAKIYLEKTDENVAYVESRLFGGDVLGFQLAEELSRNIVTQKSTNTVAYVLRKS